MRPCPKPTKARKAARPPTGKAWMEQVARLPCVICARWPVQVHHVTHGRFSQAKAHDTDTIPLCFHCHLDLHARKATWADKYGPDYGYLPFVKDKIERKEFVG